MRRASCMGVAVMRAAHVRAVWCAMTLALVARVTGEVATYAGTSPSRRHVVPDGRP